MVIKAVYVAPRVGAWIETVIRFARSLHKPSHPVWVRGLKLDAIEIIPCTDKSHPVWVRGLKPMQCRCVAT